jgi:hypothetical protein
MVATLAGVAAFPLTHIPYVFDIGI